MRRRGDEETRRRGGESFTVSVVCVSARSCRTGVSGLAVMGEEGFYRHTARGTRPGEEAAGGAVMAVMAPGLRPFTALPESEQGT